MRWSQEKRHPNELIEYYKNPRKIGGEELQKLKDSIHKFGLAEPIIINTDNTVIGGHARLIVMKDRGEVEVDVFVPERELTASEVEELNIRLNKNIAGQWDFDILANQFDVNSLIDWGFRPDQIGISVDDKDLEEESKEEPKNKEHICPKCGHTF